MNSLQRRYKDSIAEGSMQDVAEKSKTAIAECFIDCTALVLVDTSATMAARDIGDGRSRYEAACDELAKLQRDIPGKVAVISFSSSAEFCPSGFPRYIGLGTKMAIALRFIKAADGCDISLICIGDGEPNDEYETLQIAQTFESKINCIFIGPEGSPGADFMRQLAAATGGIAMTTKTTELKHLAATVRLLLTA